MINNNVRELLDEFRDTYKVELEGYVFFDCNTCESVPKGAHIKIIDLYGNLYNKGFLISIKNIDKPSRIILITTSYRKNKSIKLINYFVFYKKLKLTRREQFLNLLKKINDNKINK